MTRPAASDLAAWAVIMLLALPAVVLAANEIGDGLSGLSESLPSTHAMAGSYPAAAGWDRFETR
jgi:hypothetical protein